jgi:hypothetical protein
LQPDETSHYPGEEKNDIIPVEAEGQQAAMRLNKLPGPPYTTKRGVTQRRLHGSGKGGYADLLKRLSEQDTSDSTQKEKKKSDSAQNRKRETIYNVDDWHIMWDGVEETRERQLTNIM